MTPLSGSVSHPRPLAIPNACGRMGGGGWRFKSRRHGASTFISSSSGTPSIARVVSHPEASQSYRGAPLWYPSSGFPNFARPWVTPNLRVMRCTQYIPPRSCPPFGSITLFILSLTLLPGDAYIQVEELCMFLTSMAGLTEFDLELQTHDSCTAGYDLREDLEFVILSFVHL